MPHDLNVLALFKGSERFIFVYDDASRDELLAAVRAAAADPGVALNWFDAAVLAERAKAQMAAPDDETEELPERPAPRLS